MTFVCFFVNKCFEAPFTSCRTSPLMRVEWHGHSGALGADHATRAGRQPIRSRLSRQAFESDCHSHWAANHRPSRHEPQGTHVAFSPLGPLSCHEAPLNNSRVTLKIILVQADWLDRAARLGVALSFPTHPPFFQV